MSLAALQEGRAYSGQAAIACGAFVPPANECSGDIMSAMGQKVCLCFQAAASGCSLAGYGEG